MLFAPSALVLDNPALTVAELSPLPYSEALILSEIGGLSGPASPQISRCSCVICISSVFWNTEVAPLWEEPRGLRCE